MNIRELEHLVGDGRKIRAAQMLVERDYTIKGEHKKTYEEIAEEVGVSRQALYEWRTKDIAFIKLMEAYSDVHLAQYRSLADSQLINLIRGTSSNGIASVKGLEMFYKLQGRLAERSEVVQVGADEATVKPMTDKQIEAELEALRTKLKH